MHIIIKQHKHLGSTLISNTYNDIQNNVTNEIITNEIIEEVDNTIQPDNENKKDNKDKKEEQKKKEKANTQTSNSPYYLKVNYGANVVTAYKKDEKGQYTIAVKAMVCSAGTATPRSGVYKTSNKYVWKELMGGVYGQYSTRIVGGILFHSVPYVRTSKDSLKYKYYDKLGTKASAGCIRLTVADALWIYNNCPLGTQVEFYSSSNPGPLGKPSAQKISNASEELRNWDPTDPDPNNPWKKANKQENNNVETKPNTPAQNTTQTNTVKPNTLAQNTTQTNTVKPSTSSQNTTQANTVKPNTPAQNTTQTNTVKPNTSSQNTTQPNTTKPSTQTPATLKPSTTPKK